MEKNMTERTKELKQAFAAQLKKSRKEKTTLLMFLVSEPDPGAPNSVVIKVNSIPIRELDKFPEDLELMNKDEAREVPHFKKKG